MHIEEFYNEICRIPDSFENRDLEEYLLALMGAVVDYKDDEMTFELALKVILDSFKGKPVPFQEEWLKVDRPPDSNRMSKKFTNPEIKDSFNKKMKSKYSGIDFTIEVLKFQIAELHKMRGKQLENEYRYFGVASESGNYWFNFDPFANLECGVRCMIDNLENRTSLDWPFIGELLENGRIYE